MSENPFNLSAKDLLDVFKRHKGMLKFWTLCIPLLLLSYTLTRTPLYKADATFREKGKKQNENMKGAINLALLAGLNENNENTALSLFKSRTLIGEAIIKKSKQAVLKRDQLQLTWPRNFVRNLQSEYALLFDKHYPILAEEDLPIAVEGLRYVSEKPLNLKLHFLSDRQFILLLPNKEKAFGELNKPLQHEEFQLTIISQGNEPLANQKFALKLNPLQIAYKKVKKKLVVEQDYRDKGLLKLSFRDPDRKEAALFLNCLLSTYQEHQWKEHERLCKEQLAYLNDRQNDAGIFIEGLMVKHAKTMSFQGPTIDLLFQNSQSYLQKLLAIDLESNRLKNALEQGRVYYDTLGSEGGSSNVINQFLGEIRILRQQADAIAVALENQPQPRGMIKKDKTQEYQGIDLASANQLFLEYSARLNEAEGEINHHQFLAQQVQTPNFEVGSLSTVLKDPVSHEIIQKAAYANLLLQDQDNRSTREQERLKNELALHKGILKTHIEQTKDLLQLKKNLLQEKIWELQTTQYDLIQQKIGVLEQQLEDYLKTRMGNLEQERSVIEEQQALLRAEMLKLPSKWASEKMIEQHLETSKKMIEKIAEAVEAKNISAKLDLSQSAPLDPAITPLHPESPMILLLAVVGGLAGFCVTSAFFVLRECQMGFPARKDNLLLQNQLYLGKLSPNLPKMLSDQDLETLRRIAREIEGVHVVSLQLNRGVNYALPLAELLTKGGRKVTVLSCLFDGEEKDHAKGVLDYLKGEPLHQEEKGNCTWISSGGITRFGKEAIDSPRFRQLFHELKQKCDCLLLLNRAPLLSAETESLMALTDRSVLTLNGERLSDLNKLFKKNPLFID